MVSRDKLMKYQYYYKSGALELFNRLLPHAYEIQTDKDEKEYVVNMSDVKDEYEKFIKEFD